MSSEIYLIDYYANNIKSKIHSSSIISKFIFVLVLLSAIIFSTSNFKLVLYILLVISLMYIAKLPVKKLLKWSIYPLIFSLVFAISQLFYSYELAATTMLRASSSILMMIFFTTTTGFNQIFEYVPSRTLRNSLFLTYRFFFISVDTFNQKIKISKLRGLSDAKLNRKMRATAQIVAYSFIEIIEKAERVYKILEIRGFNKKIAIPKKVGLSVNDYIIFLSLLGVIIIWLI